MLPIVPFRKCDGCQKTAWPNIKLKTCSRCLAISYCNETCQINDWGRHKKICKEPSPADDDGRGRPSLLTKFVRKYLKEIQAAYEHKLSHRKEVNKTTTHMIICDDVRPTDLDNKERAINLFLVSLVGTGAVYADTTKERLIYDPSDFFLLIFLSKSSRDTQFVLPRIHNDYTTKHFIREKMHSKLTGMKGDVVSEVILPASLSYGITIDETFARQLNRAIMDCDRYRVLLSSDEMILVLETGIV